MNSTHSRFLYCFGFAAASLFVLVSPGQSQVQWTAAPINSSPLLRVQIVIGNDSSGFTSAGGAVVTLDRTQQATDVWCPVDSIRICNSQGYATLPRRSGSFSITAQYDVIVPGTPSETVRLATSLIDVNPSSLEMVIPIFVDDEEPDLDLNANLNGMVTGIPPLGAGEILTVEVSSLDGGPDYNFWTVVNLDPMDLTQGDYSIAVPAGYTMDLALVRRSSDFTMGGPTAAMLDLGVAIGPGSNSHDIVYGSQALLPFSSQNVAYPNQMLGTGAQCVFLSLAGGLGRDVEILLFKGPGVMPSSLQVPPLTHPAYQGLVPGITSEQYDVVNDDGAYAWERLDATDYTFDMLGLPGMVGLASSQSVPTALAQTFSYSVGAGAANWSNGLDLIEVESENTGITGVDALFWTMISRPASLSPTAIRQPATAWPMFGKDGSFELTTSTSRFDVPVDFDSFFGRSFAQNLSQLTDQRRIDADADSSDSFDTGSCDLELFSGTRGIPVRLLHFTGNGITGVPADRLQLGGQTVLDCIVDNLNAYYLPQTGISFRAESVVPVFIGPEDLVAGGNWGPEQVDGELSEAELLELRNNLVAMPNTVESGMLVIAPVHKVVGTDPLGNPTMQLGLTASTVGEVYTPLCGSTIDLADIDNMAFITDLGDGHTFAHEVGHCLGLGHCDDADSLMHRQRSFPSSGQTCLTPIDRESCFSSAQIQQVQEAACEYLMRLAPY